MVSAVSVGQRGEAEVPGLMADHQAKEMFEQDMEGNEGVSQMMLEERVPSRNQHSQKPGGASVWVTTERPVWLE